MTRAGGGCRIVVAASAPLRRDDRRAGMSTVVALLEVLAVFAENIAFGDDDDELARIS